MSFVIVESQLGSFDPDTQVLAADDVAETNFCPVNGIQASSDCAVVTMTSSSNDVVGDLIASATINGITITDTEIVTNTGINSGGPDQNSFTITRLTDAGLNHATNAVVAIEGDVLNNEGKRIRVDLADFFNNPVPVRTKLEQISGTIDPIANVAVVGVGTRFKSELAVGDRIKVSGEVREIVAIADDTNLTVDVAFSNNLNDISPERIAAPAYQGGMGQPYGARSTVLAYAVGEESFIDVNGNEEYDFGETFFDLTEAILDKNEDGVLGDFEGNSATAATVGPYNDAGIGTGPPGEARDKSKPFCYGPQTIVGLNDGVNDSVEQ